MSHAINSHILTSTNPCINKAISQVFNLTYAHSGAVTKIEVINSDMHRSEHNLVMSGWHTCNSGSGIFFHVFASYYRHYKNSTFRSVLSKFFKQQNDSAIIAIKHVFSDTLTFCYAPWGLSKPLPFRLGLQHHHQGPAGKMHLIPILHLTVSNR